MTMPARLGLLALALVLGLAAGRPMTEAEAKKALLGLDMRGHLTEPKTPFRECIAPNGKTTYWYRGEIDEGKMTVGPDGAVCFSYVSSGFTDQACFRAFQEGRNIRFQEIGGETVWVATDLRRVKACPGKDVPVS